MTLRPTILIYEQDRSVLASLLFSLGLEGYRVFDGESETVEPLQASCLIIEQRHVRGDGLALLAQIRASGCGVPAVLLATNPTPGIRDRAAAAGAMIIEKPLLTDELTHALRSLTQPEQEA